MVTLGITQFKAHALQVLDKVAKTREEVVITRRGKPIACITPFQTKSNKPVSGALADALVFEKDIVSPLGGDIWESAQ